MQQNIRITNSSPRTATIDIEGIIGVAENLQFDDPQVRVATYEKFRNTIDEIRKLKTPRVVVNIRSAGGDVNDALLIHDSLASLDARITTRCYGYIASAATIIAQSASQNRREISSNALYLIHNSVSRAEGNARALSQTLDLLQKTDLRIAAIYASRSGRPEDEFLALMNENGGNGRWLSPEEAFELGLVDRIIGAAPISNSASDQLRPLNLPQVPENLEHSEYIKGSALGRKWKDILTLLGFGEEEPADETGTHNTAPVESVPETPQAQAEINESNSAKLLAKVTATIPKEDPALTESKLSANSSAYEQDALNFK